MKRMIMKPRPTIHLQAACCLMILVMLISGCRTTGRSGKSADAGNKTTGTTQPPTGERQLWISGADYLGQSNEQQLSIDAFSEAVSRYLEAERIGSAIRFVCRHPDTAIRVLDGILLKDQFNDLERFVAAVYDLKMSNPGPDGGRQSLMEDDSDTLSQYKRTRRDVVAHIDAGRYQAAIAQSTELVRIADQADHDILQMDARSLSGSVLIASDRKEAAITAIRHAAEQFHRSEPYRAAYLYILLSKLQESDSPSPADWKMAVASATRLLENNYPVTDPKLWQSIIEHRPDSCQWPRSTIVVMRQMNRSLVELKIPTGPESGSIKAGREQLESLIWSRIGQWHNRRNNYQAALVAYRKAEDLNHYDPSAQQLRLAQARMLVQIEQYQPAANIITTVAATDQPGSVNAATALLGVIQLRRNNLEEAVSLLEQATADETSRWPGRADALGDLGLAYLMLGNEQAGLGKLHNAQDAYRSEKDHDHLIESLNNEARYYLNTRNYTQAIEIQARIDELELEKSVQNLVIN